MNTTIYRVVCPDGNQVGRTTTYDTWTEADRQRGLANELHDPNICNAEHRVEQATWMTGNDPDAF